jgi:hypothetical protein
MPMMLITASVFKVFSKAMARRLGLGGRISAANWSNLRVEILPSTKKLKKILTFLGFGLPNKTLGFSRFD